MAVEKQCICGVLDLTTNVGSELSSNYLKQYTIERYSRVERKVHKTS
jgi:hypothetical protein